MIGIWKFYFTEHLKGQHKEFYVCYWSLVAFTVAVGFMTISWWSYWGLFSGIFALFMWFFFVPCAIYLIDFDAKQNPYRAKTFRNLVHILLGKAIE